MPKLKVGNKVIDTLDHRKGKITRIIEDVVAEVKKKDRVEKVGIMWLRKVKNARKVKKVRRVK